MGRVGIANMKGRHRRTAITLALIALTQASFAQEAGSLIESKPQGAAIVLDGEYRISATTPVTLPGNINGMFRLKASKPGYEQWNGDIVLVPGQSNHISFTLSPKTRFKATLRSILFPGWGQFYSEQRFKGLAVSAATFGLGIATIMADGDFRNKRDEYFQAQVDLDNATDAQEIARLRRLVQDKNREAYDAETERNMFLVATGVVYGFGVLDALIFFPERKVTVEGTRLSASFDGDRLRLDLSAPF